jgi:two-component system, chemotaxis family, response regulator Rcp1
MSPGIPNLWLVVEDDANDHALVERACRRISPPPMLLHVRNGQAARDYLLGLCDLPDQESPVLPALILSDIKMPRMDGLELLAWVKSHPTLSVISFVILTGSTLQVDRDRARELRADGYLVKPSSFSVLIRAVDELMHGGSST